MDRLLYKCTSVIAMEFVTLKKQISYPALLPIVSVILCVIVFLLDQFIKIPNELVFWLPFVVIQIVISTACVILIKKLNYGAHNDELTGLYNRRYFLRKSFLSGVNSVFVHYNLSTKDNRDAREPLWDLFNVVLFVA